MGHYRYQFKKLRVELEDYSKIHYSQKYMDATMGTTHSEDENYGHVFMFSKVTNSI